MIRPHARSLAVLLVVMGVLAAVVGARQKDEITIKGTVKGDGQKQPLAGVSVVAYRNDAEVAKATTDKDGAYTLKVAKGTKLKVRFSHSSWNELTESNIPGDADQHLDRLLEPTDDKVNGTTHEGKVVRVDAGKLTISDKDSKNEHTHDIPADAKITIDGKEAKLTDLKMGMVIKVTTAKKGDAMVVVKIEGKKD